MELLTSENKNLLKVYKRLASNGDDGFSLNLTIVANYILSYEQTLYQFQCSPVDFGVLLQFEFHLNVIKNLYLIWYNTPGYLFEKEYINWEYNYNIPFEILQIWGSFDRDYTKIMIHCTILHYIGDREYKKLFKCNRVLQNFYYKNIDLNF